MFVQTEDVSAALIDSAVLMLGLQHQPDGQWRSVPPLIAYATISVSVL